VIRYVRRAALLATSAGLLLVPAGAQGSVDIGANLEALPALPASCSGGPQPGCTYLATVPPPLGNAPGGMASPVNGTITSWRIRVGVASTTSAALQVIRPFAGGLFNVAASTATQAPPINSTTQFSTSLPIAKGDAVGLKCCAVSAGTFFYAGTSNSFTQPPLTEGDANRAPSGTAPLVPAINATIEPSNSFTVDPKSKKKGKVLLELTLPNDGTVAVAVTGKKSLVKPGVTVDVLPGAGEFKLKPTKAGKKKLEKKGKAKTKVAVTYTPKFGQATTQTVKVKLKG
jgi:hypothetical protein